MRFSGVLTWLATLVMVQACVAPSARATDTNAVIPYKTLDDMFQPIEAVDPAKLEIHVAVVSRNKAVHPADITLTIQSARAGMIPRPAPPAYQRR